MRGATTEPSPVLPGARATAIDRARHVRRLEVPPVSFVTRTMPEEQHADATMTYPAARPETAAPGLGAASARPSPSSATRASLALDPDVWLIALPTGGGGLRSLEGAGRAGAIRVSRPYGHLRTIRPITLDPLTGEIIPPATPTPHARRARGSAKHLGSAATLSPNLPANRPRPAVVSAVEVETDAGTFRVERMGGVLSHSDLAWAMANLDTGEPESLVPLPRRQLALLLTLLPTPQDPEHPENDPIWGWAHRLRGPWERGPLHVRGRLGRLIAFDADESGKGMHRACFELLGGEEVVWAVGVPCFRTGSVYELVPLGKGLSMSRWLNWPLPTGRKRAGSAERPAWEIARVVYRVGAPRWPLAGVVEPLGPIGVAG